MVIRIGMELAAKISPSELAGGVHLLAAAGCAVIAGPFRPGF